MPRMKKLKTNGNSIESYEVVGSKVKSSHSDADIDVVLLRVSTIDGEFRYRIYRDPRVPDINQIKNHIESSLQRAKEEFLNVEITEYSERNYLFFNVQSIETEQYSGRRV